MSIATTICPNCGVKNLPDSVTCTACGENLGSSPETSVWVSITTTRLRDHLYQKSGVYDERDKQHDGVADNN